MDPNFVIPIGTVFSTQTPHGIIGLIRLPFSRTWLFLRLSGILGASVSENNSLFAAVI
jgi:hypothetical protein